MYDTATHLGFSDLATHPNRVTLTGYSNYALNVADGCDKADDERAFNWPKAVAGGLQFTSFMI